MKSKEYLFVDGYNIINAWNELKELSEVDLQSARDALIDKMVEYHVYTRTEVIVVFDAHLVAGNCGKKEKIKGIDIVYTKELQTADAYIEQVVDKIGRIKKVRVATSDFLEQQVILGRGGTRISARELKLEIEEMKRHMNRSKHTINSSNDMTLGRLGEGTIAKLEQWKRENLKK